jgi:hypothetical protein
MLDHHLQRDIVYRLAFLDGARFSELKPDDVENKLFTYHLQKLLAAGYVEKGEDGLYRLSAEGRRIGVGAFRDRHMATDRAYSILILAIRRASDGAWLLYRRKTHPLRGKCGYMHTTPVAMQEAPERASAECKEKTGLEGTFSVIGEGYFRFFEGEELESFTHFTLLKCDDIQGELFVNDERGEFYWEKDPDFAGPDMLANMETLHEIYEDGSLSFVEKTFQL